MSVERRRLMLAYRRGVRTHSARKGMKGSIARANEILKEIPGSWMPQQFDNPANLEVHRRQPLRKSCATLRDAPPTALITGVGTGGHITACAEVLRKPHGRTSRFSP